MLAASPSLGSNFQYTVSNNGSVSVRSPKASPRFSALQASLYPSQSAGPARRSTYRDSATQYSSMDASNDSADSRPAIVPDAGQGPGGREVEAPTVEPAPSAATANIPSQTTSPNMKRRQGAEPGVTVQPSAAPQPTALKRPKGSKLAKVLPIRYEFCDVEDVVILIADMISELIETNDNLPLRDVVLTRFHSRTPPGISVLDYLQRLAKHAALTPPLLLSMVYYIDRLCSLYPAFTITSLTVHRFLITAATVAAKGLSDSFWNNSTYARVGGIKLAELGLLELEFLYRVDWKIVPKPETLVEYYQGLVGRTDDYVLESEIDSGAKDTRAEETDVLGSDTAARTNVTDSDWNKWMADNATAAKKGPDITR